MATMTDRQRPDSIEAIGRRLEFTRIALNRGNAATFAKSIGISPQAWSNYITGDNNISLDVALNMCQKYPVTLDWIFRGNSYGMPADLLQRIEEAEIAAEAQTDSKRRPA